ncbi:MAG: tetratricopeptide repeat protein [Sandaracinaceae bacterium]
MIPAVVQGGDRAPGEGFLVLWLGGPGRWEPRVQALLDANGIRVEDSGLDVLVERACQRAPDLVVLTGAAASAPKGVVTQLAEKHPARSVPIVAIGPSESAKPKPRSRYGLVATLDREAEPDVLAKQIVQLLRGLSRRPAKWRIKASRSDIPTIAERFAKNARSGLLAARGAGAIAFDRSVGVAPPPEVLVTMLTSDIDYLTFYERPSGRIRVLDDAPYEDQTAPPLDGARVLVVDGDVGRAGRLAARVEAAGGQARAIGLDRTAIGAAKAIDPTLIVVGAHALSREDCEPLWTEPRFVDSSLLVLSDKAFEAPSALLLPPIADLASVELTLSRRLSEGSALAERLETLGTARWLKVLGRVPHDVTFRVFAAAGRGRVDLSGGRVRGAAFRPSDSRMAMLEGRAAVDALLGLPFGRVLAGDVEAIPKLEGSRGTRKTSVIGHVQSPEEGKPRPIVDTAKKGLVAEEVFLHTPDRTAKPAERLLPSEPVRAPTTRPPEGQRTSDVPMQDLGDDEDFEMPTRNYTADAIAELQAELRSAAKVSESEPPPRAPTSSPAPPRPSPRPPPRSEPPPQKAPAEARPAEKAKPERVEPAPIAKLPAPRARPEPIAEATPAASSKGTWWFAAGIVLALGVGGYAAYQLSMEAPPPLHAEGPSPIVPGPPDRPVAETPPASEDGTGPAEPIAPVEATDPPPDDEPLEPEVETTEPEVEPGEIQVPPPNATAEGMIEQAIDAARRSAFPESETFARQALAIDPHNPTAAYRLAVALYRQQRHDEALDWARRSAEWDDGNPRARSLQGDLYMRTGRFETALTAYRAALDVEPNYGPATRGIERLRARGLDVD